MIDATLLDPHTTRDLAPELLNADGRMIVRPAAWWAGTTVEERALFGHVHGIYSFPTSELVAWLHDAIGGRPAIEVGAGHGVLAEALGIPATDSKMQDDPAIRRQYAAAQQPTVRYGPNVERLEARAAIKRHKPRVAIGCWLTHRYNPRQHDRGGNMYGPDLGALINNVETFIFIGNAHTHRLSPIWQRKPVIHTPPWLYSRAASGGPDLIAVFGKTA